MCEEDEGVAGTGRQRQQSPPAPQQNALPQAILQLSSNTSWWGGGLIGVRWVVDMALRLVIYGLDQGFICKIHEFLIRI